MPTGCPSRKESTQPDRLSRDWAGAVVAVLGCGPGISREQVDALRGRARVIAIKESARLAPWADAFYCCDRYWFDRHMDFVKEFKGRVFTLENFCLRQLMPRIECLGNDGTNGFTDEPDRIRHGKNSGYQAIHIAAHLGARRIILLGFDMQPDKEGRLHWFGNRAYHPAQPTVFRMFMIPKFKALAEELKKRDIDVVNCTPGSELTDFRTSSVEAALQ